MADCDCIRCESCDGDTSRGRDRDYEIAIGARVSVAAHEAPRQPSALAMAAITVARRELLHGEAGGNNRGPDVVRYRGGKDDRGSWCAAFVSYCFEQAAEELGICDLMPFKRSHGAKKLYRRISKAGSSSSSPAPGDVVCWDRGRRGDWRGHVGIVISVDGGAFVSIEGNRGTYPSLVRKYRHELGEARLVGFARI